MIPIKTKINEILSWLTTQRGNVIAYIAVVLIIFGVLGGVMASLLTSSMTSSATPNYSRRALYMAEAGMRYGLSELRNTEDWEGKIADLNTITYTLNPNETFELNIFGPWYESGALQYKTAGQSLTLTVPRGEVPVEYSIPAGPPYLSIINFGYTFEGILPTNSAEIDGFTRIDATTIQLDLRDDFGVGVESEEKVCIAVPLNAESIVNNPILPGDTLYVAYQAKDIFPQYGGAIEIGKILASAEEIDRSTYFYDERFDDEANNRVELRNVTGRPDSKFPFTTELTDYAIFSDRNHIIIATGTSEAISAGGTLNEGVYVYDATQEDPDGESYDGYPEKILSNIPGFITPDLVDKTINIGSGYTPPAGNTAFGAAWYDADLPVGGDQDFCQAGECKFGIGIRVFFTLLYSGDGDGVTFTVMNAGNNSSSSVGGDIELSELLGYAGDSRLAVTPSLGTDYLDGIGNGLRSPKMALEFDTLTNLNEPLQYCKTATNLEQNSRNDPTPNSTAKDVLQYVYWGSAILDIDCRGDHPSYDDNRHDAIGQGGTEIWRFGAAGPISVWRPAIGPDGTIYISALDATLYALNEDGSVKWTFSLGVSPGGDNAYMPGVDPNTGTIYSDISGNAIVAIDPNGNELWRFGVNSDIDSTPTVGPDGRVYFGTDFEQSLYAIDPAARATALPFPQPNEWKFPTGGEVDNVPALNSDATVVYFVSKDNNLYAVNTADGTERWRFPILTEPAELDSSPTVDPTDGTIYVGSDDNNLYAINPNGTEKWRFTTGGEIESSAAIDPFDGTIYIGSDDTKVWAVNPDGTEKWQFFTGGNVESSAIIGVDGSILIGSLNGTFYAIGRDGTENWNFPTGGPVPSSPTIGKDGTIYIGSDDFNLYAIFPFAEPRNFRDLLVTAIQDGGDIKVGGEIVDVNDINNWLAGNSVKPWAIRVEVMRSLDQNAGGNYEYTLRTWVRQCNQIDCSDVFGTFFQDLSIEYRAKAPHLEQTIELVQADHDLFDRFLFGFTGATGEGTSQNAIFGNIRWNTIRPNDAIITTDPMWP